MPPLPHGLLLASTCFASHIIELGYLHANVALVLIMGLVMGVVTLPCSSDLWRLPLEGAKTQEPSGNHSNARIRQSLPQLCGDVAPRIFRRSSVPKQRTFTSPPRANAAFILSRTSAERYLHSSSMLFITEQTASDAPYLHRPGDLL